jgi:flagellar basal body rod protein FlgF
VQDAAVAAQFNGNPTDIASGGGWISVVDGNGPLSHLSVFSVDEDGNLTMNGAATIDSPANGAAIVTGGNQLPE